MATIVHHRAPSRADHCRRFFTDRPGWQDLPEGTGGPGEGFNRLRTILRATRSPKQPTGQSAYKLALPTKPLYLSPLLRPDLPRAPDQGRPSTVTAAVPGAPPSEDATIADYRPCTTRQDPSTCTHLVTCTSPTAKINWTHGSPPARLIFVAVVVWSAIARHRSVHLCGLASRAETMTSAGNQT